MSGKAPQRKNAHRKELLPAKVCSACGKPFNWRKKWEKVWGEVKFCSERCRKSK